MHRLFGFCCSSQSLPEGAEVITVKKPACAPFWDDLDEPLTDAMARQKGSAPPMLDLPCTLDAEAPVHTRRNERQRLSEDEEWQKRQEVTGVVGRLVYYDEGEDPSGDILALSRTEKGRITVVDIDKYGSAAIAGVNPGDQLVSINGQRNFHMLEPEDIRKNLKAPATLVFIGFAGHERGEVRINHGDENLCVLSDPVDRILEKAVDPGLGYAELASSNSAWLHDFSAFRAPIESAPGSIFLQTKTSASAKGSSSGGAAAASTAGSADDAAGISVDGARRDTAMGVYELRRQEARLVVERAFSNPADARHTKNDSASSQHLDVDYSLLSAGLSIDIDDAYTLRNI